MPQNGQPTGSRTAGGQRYSEAMFPDPWVRRYGIGSEIDEYEWRMMLQRRQELVDSITARINMGRKVASTTGLDPRTAQQMADLAQLDPNLRADRPRGLDEMLGAADFYGIRDAEKMNAQQLQQAIEEHRLYLLQRRTEDGEPGLLQEGYDVFSSALATLFVGSTDSVIEVSQRVPFIGDWLAKKKTIQDADRWLAMVEEGYRGDLTDGEVTGWNISKGLAGLIGYALPATAAWKGAGALGGVATTAGIGTRLSPIARAAIQGGVSTWMLEGGGNDPLEDRAIKVAVGAGIAGGVTWAVPKILARLQRSFPSRFGGGNGAYDDGFAQYRSNDYQDPVYEAELVDELFLPRSRLALPPGPMGLLPDAPPIEAEYLSNTRWAPGAIDVEGAFPLAPRPGTAVGFPVEPPPGPLSGFPEPPTPLASGPRLLPGPIPEAEWSVARGLNPVALPPGAPPEMHALAETYVARARLQGLDPETGFGDLPTMRALLPVAEADPSMAVMVLEGRPAITAELLNQLQQEMQVPFAMFRSRGSEVVAAVPQAIAQEVHARVVDAVPDTFVGVGATLPEAEAQVVAARTAMSPGLAARARASSQGWRAVDPATMSQVTPNPGGLPKSDPLPLPPLRGDIRPEQVQGAWDVVSGRYPRLASTITEIRPLRPALMEAGGRAAYLPTPQALTVHPDEVLRSDVLFHEFAHVAQRQRRQVGPGVELTPDDLNLVEAYARRMDAAARQAPRAPLRTGDALAIRRGALEPGGAHFSLPGSSTYYDPANAFRDQNVSFYDLGAANILDASDPAVAVSLIEQALVHATDPSYAAALQAVRQDAAQYGLSYTEVEELGLAELARRRGYDGIKFFENDDWTSASTVNIWDYSRVREVPKNFVAEDGTFKGRRYTKLAAGEAEIEAQALAKHAAVIESPALGDGLFQVRYEGWEIDTSPYSEVQGDGRVHTFMTPSGSAVQVRSDYVPEDQTIYINWAGNPIQGLEPASYAKVPGVGPKLMMQILARVAQEHPEARFMKGWRTSGAGPSREAVVPVERLLTDARRASGALAQQVKYTDVDVATARMAANPGQISIVRGIDTREMANTVRRIVRDATEEGIGPQDFRIVERGGSVDLLVSDGLTITNARVKQYQQFGMFEGQRAVTRSGQEVLITKPGSEMVEVKSLTAGNLTAMIPARELMPLSASFVPDEVAAEAGIDGALMYEEFRDFVINYMDDGAERGGLNRRFGWLDTETSSLLPTLLDAFLGSRGLTQPQLKKTMEALFNQYRVAEFRSLAPEDAAFADAVTREVAEEVRDLSLRGDVDTPLFEAAEAKGFQLVPYVNSTGYTLRDKLSGLEIPVADEDAVDVFLSTFEREMPDVTPISDVPMEVSPTVPGLPVMSDGTPELAGGAEGFRYYQERVGRWLIRELERLGWGAGGAGGGGGLPPGGGTGPAFGGEPLRIGSMGSTLGSQFANAPQRLLAETLEDITSQWVQWAFPFRSFAVNAEQRLSEIGVDRARVWQQYNDIVIGRARAHNDAVPLYREWQEISSQFRRRLKRHGHVARIQELPTWNDQLAEMQRLGYSDREIGAQQALSVFMDRLFGLSGIDNSRRIYNYISHVRQRQSLGVRDPWSDPEGSLGDQVRWFAELAREGNMQFRELDVDLLVPLYIRGMTFHQHVAPAWEAMAADWQANIPSGVQTTIPPELRAIVKGWLHIVRFGHNGEEELAVQGIRRVLNKVGIPVTNSDVQSFWNTIQSNMYRAGIGLKPHVWFRDAINPLLTGVKIGMKPVNEAYYRILTSATYRQEAMERAFAGGWLERGAVQLPGGDMFAHHPVHPHGSQVNFQPAGILQWMGYGPEQAAAVREGMGRVGDFIHDATPRPLRGGIQGKPFIDPLYFYTKLGEFNRLVSGEAGWLKASRAIAEYRAGTIELDAADRAAFQAARVSRLTTAIPTTPEEILLAKSGADVWRTPVRRRFLELINAGQDEDAAVLLANEAANMQNRYGTVEHSLKIQSSGVVGRQAMMYGTFTMQHAHQLKDGMADGTIPLPRRVGFALRYGAVTAAIGSAALYTGWNFYKWLWPGSLTFMGGPMVEPTMEAYMRVRGRVNEATGQYVTPMQKAAEANAQNPNRNTPLDMLNPYLGGFQTAQGLNQVMGTGNSYEGTLRYLLTGDKSNASDVEQWLEGMQLSPPGAGFQQ